MKLKGLLNLFFSSRSWITGFGVAIRSMMLFALLAFSFICAETANATLLTFTNPLHTFADPYITYLNGDYYLVGTDGSSIITVVRSHTLKGFNTGDADVFAVYNTGIFFESPELVWLGAPYNKWYIYYTTYDGMVNTAYVIESDTTSATGTYHAKATLATGIYDSTFRTIGGSDYLVSSTGSQIVIHPMSNPWTMTGTQKALFGKTQAWEMNFIEAPQVYVSASGFDYLFYSCGIYNTQNYKEGAAKFMGGDPTVAANWSKVAGPIFQGTGNNGNFCTATCTPFSSPDGNEDYFIYGGFNTSNFNGNRTTRVQQMSWNADGSPDMGTPVPLGDAIAEPTYESRIDAVVQGAPGGSGVFQNEEFPTWGSWNPIGAQGTNKTVVSSIAPYTLQVFTKGAGNQLWIETYDRGWSGWSSLGGQLTSDPGTAVWRSNPTTDLFVFYQGTNASHIMQRQYEKGAGWLPEIDLGASPAIPGGAPAACSYFNGYLNLFVRGTNNTLWMKAYTSGVGWSGWTDLGGSLTSDPAASSWGNGRIDVFAQCSTPSGVCQKTDVSGVWSGWTSLGVQGTRAPAVCSYSSGYLDVFAVGSGSNSNLWTKSFKPPTGWSTSWSSLAGTCVSAPGAVSWTTGN
jgi:GH43 family beta-xylosidase